MEECSHFLIDGRKAFEGLSSQKTEMNLSKVLFFPYRPKTDKQYSRDMFVFLSALLVFVAVVFTVKKTPEKLLNRDQTEEWKGWMQVGILKNSISSYGLNARDCTTACEQQCTRLLLS